eukprot:sb/3463614/
MRNDVMIMSPATSSTGPVSAPCSEMGSTSVSVQDFPRLLSLSRNSKIKEFEEDMERRGKVLKDQLAELVELLAALEMDRNCLIEEGLTGDDVDTMLLSDESIQRRSDMINQYRSEVQQNVTRVLQLRDHITRLHRLLHRDTEIDDETFALFDSPRPSSIEALQKKLKELEVSKQSRLETYIQCLRQEIAAFQGLCFQTKCEVSSSSVDVSKTSDRGSRETINMPDITVEEIAHRPVIPTLDLKSRRETLDKTFKISDTMDKTITPTDEFGDGFGRPSLTSTPTEVGRPSLTSTPNKECPPSCGDKKLKQWEEQDDQENRNTLNQTYTLPNDLLKPAKTPDIDTEVLQLEEELDRWESFYNSNSELFELIRRWNNLNERYTQLQQPSPDKYNNRGGALLQAQKESTKIAKELPKIEQKVLADMDKILGEEIKINGMDLEDYFADNRATTTLSRSSSVRHSKKSITTPRSTPTPRTPSMRQKKASSESNNKRTPEPSPRNTVVVTPKPKTNQITSRRDSLKKSDAFERSESRRKSMRKRTSIDALDQIGKK